MQTGQGCTYDKIMPASRANSHTQWAKLPIHKAIWKIIGTKASRIHTVMINWVQCHLTEGTFLWIRQCSDTSVPTVYLYHSKHRWT